MSSGSTGPTLAATCGETKLVSGLMTTSECSTLILVKLLLPDDVLPLPLPAAAAAEDDEDDALVLLEASELNVAS